MVVTQYCMRRDTKTNHPYLQKVKDIEWNKDFLCYDNMVDFMNEKLSMNARVQEFSYVIGFNHQNVPVGLYELSHGVSDSCAMNRRDLGIFLLLSGTNRFIVAHNHPNGNCEPSVEDVMITSRIQRLAESLDIDLIQHFVIGNDGYDCAIYDEDDDNDEEDVEDEEEYIPFS